MRATLAVLASASLIVGFGAAASADHSTKKHPRYYADNSPSAIAARQRNAKTFDETQYYERDSRRIPFGTNAWWRQKELEGTRR